MKILVLKRGISREHCWSLLGNIVVSKADSPTPPETVPKGQAQSRSVSCAQPNWRMTHNQSQMQITIHSDPSAMSSNVGSKRNPMPPNSTPAYPLSQNFNMSSPSSTQEHPPIQHILQDHGPAGPEESRILQLNFHVSRELKASYTRHPPFKY
jgi:hypothetical protein